MGDIPLRSCGNCGTDYQVADTAPVGTPTSPSEAVRYVCPECGRSLRATDKAERIRAHARAR